MNNAEKNVVKLVAKLAPWLAPFPSAFFVARASMTHLALPLVVAIVVAAIIETLGIATTHTALWLSDWNASKRKNDPGAPAWVAVVLGIIYVVTTIGLTVVLEIAPSLATYAPGMFPALAVVGAVNLALISQQERREAAVKLDKADKKADRQEKRAKHKAKKLESSRKVPKQAVLDDSLDKARRGNKARLDDRLDALLTFYLDNPGAGATEASQAIGVSRQTVYTYLSQLEQAGRIVKDDGAVKVIAVPP